MFHYSFACLCTINYHHPTFSTLPSLCRASPLRAAPCVCPPTTTASSRTPPPPPEIWWCCCQGGPTGSSPSPSTGGGRRQQRTARRKMLTRTKKMRGRWFLTCVLCPGSTPPSSGLAAPPSARGRTSWRWWQQGGTCSWRQRSYCRPDSEPEVIFIGIYVYVWFISTFVFSSPDKDCNFRSWSDHSLTALPSKDVPNRIAAMSAVAAANHHQQQQQQQQQPSSTTMLSSSSVSSKSAPRAPAAVEPTAALWWTSQDFVSVCYVGTSSGDIVCVDLVTGAEVSDQNCSTPIPGIPATFFLFIVLRSD